MEVGTVQESTTHALGSFDGRCFIYIDVGNVHICRLLYLVYVPFLYSSAQYIAQSCFHVSHKIAVVVDVGN